MSFDEGGSPDSDEPVQAPGPVVSAVVVAAAGLLVLYAAGLFVTEVALEFAGPLTTVLVVAVVALWIRGRL